MMGKPVNPLLNQTMIRNDTGALEALFFPIAESFDFAR
jgi:hypothetical protein